MSEINLVVPSSCFNYLTQRIWHETQYFIVMAHNIYVHKIKCYGAQNLKQTIGSKFSRHFLTYEANFRVTFRLRNKSRNSQIFLLPRKIRRHFDKSNNTVLHYKCP